jgi:glycine cleavage system transcriptional repressor
MAANFFAVSAVGVDEPGIIAALTQAIFELDGTLADTNMSVLNGHFAMVLMVEVPESVTEERLTHSLERAARRFRLLISVQELARDELPRYFAPDETGPSQESAMVTVYGADRPGIVHGVTEAIAATGSNIIDLRTRKFKAQGACYSLFLDVRLAPGQSRDGLASVLAPVVRRHGVEVQIQSIDEAEGL